MVRTPYLSGKPYWARLSPLLTHAEDLASASGISELRLLTTTITDFFPQAAYAAVNRGRASSGLQASMQFAQLCPASAVCMMKTL
ncbi:MULTISPECIES: hypothetical protein [Paraburkholderia]|jgi:amino-acid N-acetyltransferase|uniref:Uncharacterized protein n=1 Tax=Paraburkholderia domus TaxID=2793075 RepID=A0A9N8R4D1_9BURK|nr:hypothetical protein [Paraburkholderia domus]MBK5170001.1 hypothetical protein [Burkholderia sp. R-70211]CAE6968425.1 hypothetical protein R70211_07591 [Paraburkholderia domus]